MKLKWREHERFLVTLLLLLTLGGYCVRMFRFFYHEGPAYAGTFKYYVRTFLPQAGPVLLGYFCYLWINIRMVPRLMSPGVETPGGITFFARIRAFLRRHPLQVVQAIVLYFILGIGLSIAAHYGLHPVLHPVSFFHPPNAASQGFYAALQFFVLYAVYLSIREMTIDYIERVGDRRSYLILIVNNTTAFVVGIVLLVKVFSILEWMNGGPAVGVFYSLVIGSFLIGMNNMYWLFPRYGKESFFNLPLIFRLLLLTITCALLLCIIFSDHAWWVLFFILCLFSLFITTPVSWLLYQYRKNTILQLRGMEKELIQSKSNLAFLRSQINPHFLFNVLNTLYGTALQERADRTAEGIQKLGDMMRFMLHENNLDQIRMSREIEYLENYISLQKLRTATSATVVIEDDIRADYCNHMIAPMLLIPFVENAFKHGISLQEPSWIKITLRCDATHIYFTIRNSIHTQLAGEPGKSDSGIGLHNVRERLRWLYPGRYELEINDSAHEFLVNLVIRATEIK